DVDDRRVKDVQDHGGQDDCESGPDSRSRLHRRDVQIERPIENGGHLFSFVGGSVTRKARTRFWKVRFFFGTIFDGMSETSGRLLSLLSLLQTPREWSGPELAKRLHVTTRTVRNDVERLRQLGYPVLATRGKVGGYRLSAGMAMPPLLLDDEEAIAIAVSLRTAT